MTISVDADKAFDKMQHRFMIQNLRKVGIGGNVFNLLNAMHKTLTSYLI